MTRWDYRINFQLEIVTGNPLYRAYHSLFGNKENC